MISIFLDCYGGHKKRIQYKNKSSSSKQNQSKLMAHFKLKWKKNFNNRKGGNWRDDIKWS